MRETAREVERLLGATGRQSVLLFHLTDCLWQLLGNGLLLLVEIGSRGFIIGGVPLLLKPVRSCDAQLFQVVRGKTYFEIVPVVRAENFGLGLVGMMSKGSADFVKRLTGFERSTMKLEWLIELNIGRF